MTKIIKKSTIENTTFVDIIDNNGYNSRVGVPFVSNNEQEIIDYIEENYPPFDPNEPGENDPEYLLVKYREQRASEYPSIGDQLDALWKGGDAATEMLAKVQAVKAKYPKPE
jgi:hypothetical protein